ncbi:Transcription initiation factor TFIID, subunit TAF5 [Pseudoloma neurophilia]|uniref:Transcription initiation factor TFIID, subunit TAF5 n=1 Tax=Pseudoloma neurophilia TaxID=146866 RepID=A0A0R0M616_9MICR|nr:Transcription initiation factor TFIID, subunit TAF5 [Pseudoloma neurophilia]
MREFSNPDQQFEEPVETYFEDQDVDESADKGYAKLKEWIEDSLDQFRNDLLNLLYPLFIHIYLDLLFENKIKEAKAFFHKNKGDFHNKELKILESVCIPQHLNENSLITAYRSNKYSISMGKYAFDLFTNFLERNTMTKILVLVNQFLNIKIHQGIKKNEEIEGLTEKINKNVNLETHLYNTYTEDAILKDEQYRHDHLESFILGLKNKNREKDHLPSYSFIKEEIENLKDICKRVSLNENNLPSICCYTIINTFEKLNCVDISKDFTLLALGYSNNILEIHSLKGNLKKLKDTNQLMKLKTLEEDNIYEEIGKSQKLIGHSNPIFNVKFFNSKKYLISCDMDRVYLWSLDLFTLITVYKSFSFPIWSLAVSNDDLMFACGGSDKNVSLFYVDSVQPERLFVNSLSDVSYIVFHPNSKYVIYGSCDYRIRMNEIESSELVRVFLGHTDVVTCLSVSPDGKYLLSGSKDKTIILWDIQTSKKINIFKGHTKTIFSLSFCFFGNVFVSCGADLTLRVWDFKQQLAVYHTKNTPLINVKFGYRNIVSCIGPYQG